MHVLGVLSFTRCFLLLMEVVPVVYVPVYSIMGRYGLLLLCHSNNIELVYRCESSDMSTSVDGPMGKPASSCFLNWDSCVGGLSIYDGPVICGRHHQTGGVQHPYSSSHNFTIHHSHQSRAHTLRQTATPLVAAQNTIQITPVSLIFNFLSRRRCRAQSSK